MGVKINLTIQYSNIVKGILYKETKTSMKFLSIEDKNITLRLKENNLQIHKYLLWTKLCTL